PRVLLPAAGLVLVARGLVLLVPAAGLARAGVVLAVARHAGRGPTLALVVALLGAVVVLRGRRVLGAVRLVNVAVVRSRAGDRDRHVHVGLPRARFARSRLFRAVFVRRGLRLLDQLTDRGGFARERSARGDGKRTNAHRRRHPLASFHANTAPFEFESIPGTRRQSGRATAQRR